MRKNTFFARFAHQLALFTTCLTLAPCTSKAPSENGANEGDGGIAGDQTCPEEGCKTDIVCASDNDCPSDDHCRIYACPTGTATCRWIGLDRDRDGFMPSGCGGRDCDDSGVQVDCPLSEGCPFGADVHPGAEERCNEYDDDCDGEVDEDIESIACARSEDPCQTGSLICREGQWSSCEGASGTAEICNGIDDDCNGTVDDGCFPCGNTQCDIAVGEDEHTCFEDCNGFPGDGVCDFDEGNDTLETAEFCFESPDDCEHFCGGRESCLDIAECVRDTWRVRNDIPEIVGCVDEGTPDAQRDFVALFPCWEKHCADICVKSYSECFTCACRECRSESDTCSPELCTGR